MRTKWYLALAAIVVFYTFVLHELHPEKSFDWFTTLISSFVSFVFAVLAGVSVIHTQYQETKRQEMEDLRKLLVAELSDFKKMLRSTPPLIVNLGNGSSTQAVMAHIRPLVLKKAALSANFTEQESAKLLHLARIVDNYVATSQHVMLIMNFPIGPQNLVNSMNSVNTLHGEIIQEIGSLSSLLRLTVA